MADRTETKVRAWATRRHDEEITPADIVELVLAVDDDGNARHGETMELIARATRSLHDHEQRISSLESWRHGALEQAVAEFERGHDAMHAQHMAQHHAAHRDSDPIDSDFSTERRSAAAVVCDELTQRRVWVLWGVAIFAATVIGNALLTYGIDRFLRP
ncbi:MAG: hypothetical protein QM323_04225 [Acidobacteriota bacterium]|nr:hypothetical protein [Acidobacteriota bacterium]